MTKVVFAMFPDEEKATEGLLAFKELHGQGVISVYETIVVEREDDGTFTTKHRDRRLDRRLVGIDAVLGGLFGALAGPPAAAVGFAAGTAIGRLHGYVRARVSDAFLDDVSGELKPGMYGVVAEISEQWPAPLDKRMEKLGSHLLREERRDVIEEVISKRMVERCKRLEQKFAERESAKPGLEKQRGKEFEDAKKEVERTADDARDRVEETDHEYHAMMETLEKQAKHASPDAKKQIDERMHERGRVRDERKGWLQHSLDLAEETLRKVQC